MSNLYSNTGEQIIISYLINNPDEFEEFGTELSDEMFFNKYNREIFKEIKKQYDDNGEYHYESVRVKLNDTEVFNERKDFRPEQHEYKVSISVVKEKYHLRKIKNVVNVIEEKIANKEDYESILGEINVAVGELNRDVDVSDFVKTKDTVSKLREMLDGYESGKKFGMSTGFPMLDNYLEGFKAPGVYTLSAKTGCGKTGLAINLMKNALEEGKHVAFFSLEMEAGQISMRLLTSITGISTEKIKNNELTEDEKFQLRYTLDNIVAKYDNLHINDNNSGDVHDLYLKCQKLSKDNQLDLVIIDYMQLLNSKKFSNQRTSELEDISRTIKQLALNLKVPVLSLAQLNRNSEDNTPPRIDNLKGSSAIGMDSDVIMFLHSDNADKRAYEDKNNKEVTKLKVQLNVAKNRDGNVGTVLFDFDGSTQQFFEKEEQAF